MERQTQDQYVKERSAGYGARSALATARRGEKLRAMEYRADVDTDGALTWEDPRGFVVKVDWQPDDTGPDGDWLDPDAWPVEDRAAYYRAQGMARGPAWQHAQATYDEDTRTRDAWWSAVVIVDVIDPQTGATGRDVLGGVHYRRDIGWGPDVVDILAMVDEYGMVDNAWHDMRADMIRKQCAALPPMVQRAS